MLDNNVYRKILQSDDLYLKFEELMINNKVINLNKAKLINTPFGILELLGVTKSELKISKIDKNHIDHLRQLFEVSNKSIDNKKKYNEKLDYIINILVDKISRSIDESSILKNENLLNKYNELKRRASKRFQEFLEKEIKPRINSNDVHFHLFKINLGYDVLMSRNLENEISKHFTAYFMNHLRASIKNKYNISFARLTKYIQNENQIYTSLKSRLDNKNKSKSDEFLKYFFTCISYREGSDMLDHEIIHLGCNGYFDKYKLKKMTLFTMDDPLVIRQRLSFYKILLSFINDKTIFKRKKNEDKIFYKPGLIYSIDKNFENLVKINVSEIPDLESDILKNNFFYNEWVSKN